MSWSVILALVRGAWGGARVLGPPAEPPASFSLMDWRWALLASFYT